MSANYDNSVWFYDTLSQLVYGRALMDAQVYLLKFIPANSSVLIVGGGTGRILTALAKIHPAGLRITYVEISAGMTKRSKKRDTGNNEVIFINDAIENVVLEEAFDVVITPFLFDNFKEEAGLKIFDHIHQFLKPSGMWLNTDFQLTGKWWQNMLLKSMLTFFRLICGIDSSGLPDIKSWFTRYGYRNIGEKDFFGEFILSSCYARK